MKAIKVRALPYLRWKHLTDNVDEGSWLHFLCKNINTQSDAHGDMRVVDPRLNGANLSQADWSWIRAGFFLQWHPVNSLNQTSCVTLICFGASAALEQRFERLLSKPLWDKVLQDPYILFAIVLDELSLQMDAQVWNVSRVFGLIERVSFPGRVSRHYTLKSLAKQR